MTDAKLKLTFTVEPEGHSATVVGRTAWALQELLRAGPKGITSLENPAPRLAHYVMCLRRAGVSITTIDEKHSGPFQGVHGRYVLVSKVSVRPATEASDV